MLASYMILGYSTYIIRLLGTYSNRVTTLQIMITTLLDDMIPLCVCMCSRDSII